MKADRKWIHVEMPCGTCVEDHLFSGDGDCPDCGGTGTRPVLVEDRAVTEAEVFDFEMEVHHCTNADPDVNEPAKFDELLESGMESDYCAWAFGQDSVECYRRLEKGETVLESDEIYDDASDEWMPPVHSIGDSAPDPRYTPHRQFRRATGRVVRVEMLDPDGHEADPFIIISYEPAPPEGLEAARKPCEEERCQDGTVYTVDGHHDCTSCGGRGYTGPPSEGTVLMAVIG